MSRNYGWVNTLNHQSIRDRFTTVLSAAAERRVFLTAAKFRPTGNSVKLKKIAAMET
jgi:hypothetical protein